jgi:hypothetical protein
MMATNSVRKKNADHWFLRMMIIAGLLFIHFGLNEFISVQFFLFAYAYIITARYCFANVNYWFVFVVATAIGSVGALLSGQDAHYYLVALRVSAVLSLLYTLSYRYPINKVKSITSRDILFSLEFVMFSNFVLAAGQLSDALFLRSGLFDIPMRYFALDYGTLADELRGASRGIEFFLRPSGFYSEPSALSAIGLMGFFVAHYFNAARLALISGLCVVISLSLAGIVLLAMFLCIFIFMNQGLFGSGRGRFYAGCFILLCAAVCVAVLQERIARIISGEDGSALIRVWEPLRLIGTSISDWNLFGAEKSALLSSTSVPLDTIFDNWILNQLLLFGLTGALFMGFVAFILPSLLFPILIAFGVMNGDIFYYDRFILLALAIVAVRSFKKQDAR